jgi:hypothetical protein
MATDGPDPTPCDQEVYKNGAHVFTTHSIPSNAMEGWVKQVAERSGQRVDWHFVGGRAVVKALGDIPKVMQAIEDLMPEHDRLQQAATAKLRA